jgi:hypothetical protein
LRSTRRHPPGTLRCCSAALLLCVGIVLVTILGEPCRMLILRQDKAASV